jgi:hypothetical protein
MHTIKPSPVSYLAAESGGDQGGHDDHGDDDLDGGRNGSHVECKMFVDQWKIGEVELWSQVCVRQPTRTAADSFLVVLHEISLTRVKGYHTHADLCVLHEIS